MDFGAEGDSLGGAVDLFAASRALAGGASLADLAARMRPWGITAVTNPGRADTGMAVKRDERIERLGYSPEPRHGPLVACRLASGEGVCESEAE
ncbi:MAG: hypothetical protein OXD30_11560 [Bryobacterales bacterium]|nr:hypothetical protein [Bryobacterales bacterium]